MLEIEEYCRNRCYAERKLIQRMLNEIAELETHIISDLEEINIFNCKTQDNDYMNLLIKKLNETRKVLNEITTDVEMITDIGLLLLGHQQYEYVKSRAIYNISCSTLVLANKILQIRAIALKVVEQSKNADTDCNQQ